MLLSELHGYKQYLGKSARKVLQSFREKYGTYAAHGVHAVVVVTRHNYVYKLWHKDPAWESWLEYIKANPNKHFIKVLSPIKDFPFEIANPVSSDADHDYAIRHAALRNQTSFRLKYCKLEKLKEIPDDIKGLIDEARFYTLNRISIDQFIANLEKHIDELELNPMLLKQHRKFFEAYYEVGKHFENRFYDHDLHSDNIMMRGDGTLVIVDPASAEAQAIEAPELVQIFDTELKRL